MITELVFDTDEQHPAIINRLMTEKDGFRASLLTNPEHNKRCNTIIEISSIDKLLQWCDNNALYIKSKQV